MLPVEVVSQIESIRRLLHMDTDFEIPDLAAHSRPSSSSNVIIRQNSGRFDSVGADTPLASPNPLSKTALPEEEDLPDIEISLERSNSADRPRDSVSSNVSLRLS